MKVKGISEFKPYTADLKLSDYNLNDLLPKIWADGYERRDAWFEFDIASRLLIEMFKVTYWPFEVLFTWLPIKLLLTYYILMP
jgi:hypothetical protein